MFELKEIRYEEFIEEYKGFKEESIVSKTTVKLIKEKKKTIGYCQYEINNEVLFLDALEIKDKSKGLGTRFVKWIIEKEKPKKIIGFSLTNERTIKFWEKQGAEINYYCDEENEYKDLEYFLLRDEEIQFKIEVFS